MHHVAPLSLLLLLPHAIVAQHYFQLPYTGAQPEWIKDISASHPKRTDGAGVQAGVPDVALSQVSDLAIRC